MHSHRLRILHLSDLHERGPREVEPWRKRRIFDEAWRDNLAELIQDGPFDLICFTGDAADWGKPEEFAAATQFLHGICDHLGVPHDRLFVVPGNHDVHRQTGADEWRKMRSLLSAGADPLQVSRWINGQGQPPVGVDDAWRAPLLARFDHYRAWVRDGLMQPVQAADPLGYRITVPGLPVPVHVVGLNSAWLCGDAADAKNLRLTENQIGRHLTDASGKPLEGFRLVLLHHPLDELADKTSARAMLVDHADLLLRGHLHEGEVETSIDPDRRLHQLAVGCLYEGHRADHWPNGCQTLTITLGPQGEAQHADLRFRRWASKPGRWLDDDDLYRASQQGRLRLQLASRVPVAGLNPYHPWSAATADFVGRTEILKRLEAALDEGRGVSLVGDWRTGKSLLLQVWKSRVEQKGRVVKWVSGEDREGESIGAFVRGITGLAAGDDPDDAADVLDNWVRVVGGIPLVLVDESDGVVQLPGGYRFFERVRGMLGRLAWVFASRQELDLLFEKQHRGSPLANKLEIHWVGLLEPEAAEALIARGHPSPEAAALLRRWAGTHPFYLQLFGHYLKTSASLDDALHQFRTQAEPKLRFLWNALAERDQSAMRDGEPVTRLGLKNRGLVTMDGRYFGELLRDFMREEA